MEFVTDMRGEAYQLARTAKLGGFFLNTPWGDRPLRNKPGACFREGARLPRWQENQFARNYTAFSSRFRFNGKEWDEETGNYYYGARYYDPKISVWLSVDPMSDQRPSLTPYNFVSNNPIMRIDPSGLLDGWVENELTGEYEWNDCAINQETTPEGYRFVGMEDNDVLTDMGYSTGTQTVTDNEIGVFDVNDENAGGVKSMAASQANFKSKVDVSLKLDVSNSESAKSATNQSGKTINGVRVQIEGYVQSSIDKDLRYSVTGATHSRVSAGSFSDNFVYTKRQTPKPSYPGQTFITNPSTLGYGSTLIPMQNLGRGTPINVNVTGWWFVNNKQVGATGVFGLFGPALFGGRIKF